MSRTATGPSRTTAAAADDSAGLLEPCFGILGPLEVRGSAPAVVTARRQRVILALLLLEAGRTVTLETMVHAVWGSAPPATARAQVQTAVSALRRVLDDAGLGRRIRMKGLGYTIDLAPGELDLQRFEELVAQGRSAAADRRCAAARAAYREALRLWRGEPLADVDSGLIRLRLARIGERRYEALEECFEAELQLGLHREVLPEIEEMAARFPLRERPAAQLMTALYRCGRMAEALDVYRRLRRAFIEELGLEPSPSLQRIEQAVLRGSAELDQVAPPPASGVGSLPVPRMLPGRVPDFTDREAILPRLCDRLRAVSPAVLLTGPAGVGKSAFALEAAHATRAAFPDGQLYAELPADSSAPRHTEAVLDRFLRALGFTGADIPDGLDTRAALLRNATADRRMLLVVENVSDEAQLRALTPAGVGSRLLATGRARLAPPPGAELVELARPRTADGVELLGAMAGPARIAVEAAEAAEIVELCDALPAALRAIASRLTARPHWSLAVLASRLRDEAHRLDELDEYGLDLRGVLRESLHGCGEPAPSLLRALGRAAVTEFAPWLAAALLGLDRAGTAGVLDALADARLLDEVGGPGTALRYRLPGLVGVFARELPGPAGDHGTHRVLAGWLCLADEAAERLGGPPVCAADDPVRSALDPDIVEVELADPALWFAQEHTALLAAVRWAADTREIELCWKLAVAAGNLAALPTAANNTASARAAVRRGPFGGGVSVPGGSAAGRAAAAQSTMQRRRLGLAAAKPGEAADSAVRAAAAGRDGARRQPGAVPAGSRRRADDNRK